MTTPELFAALKESLEARNFHFSSNAEAETFQFLINAESGSWPIRLVCEAAPLCFHIHCRLPVKFTTAQRTEASLALHQINLGVRFGSFWLNPQNGVVGFHLPAVIGADEELQSQISSWIGTALDTFEEHLRPLCLLACSTPEARKVLAQFSPKANGGDADPLIHAKRFELN